MDNQYDEDQTLNPQALESAQKKSRSRAVKILIVVIIIALLAGLAYLFRDLFIVATIDGRPISRFAVISELEKQSGSAVLGALIDQRLIDNEIDEQGVTIDPQLVEEEILNIETQVAIQGSTLEQALAAEGLTLEELKEEIERQFKVEKLLADRIAVSENDVADYIAENQIVIPEGQEREYQEQIASQLRSEKLSLEATLWLNNLRSQANIDYFVEY